jgi:hypothetical protein
MGSLERIRNWSGIAWSKLLSFWTFFSIYRFKEEYHGEALFIGFAQDECRRIEMVFSKLKTLVRKMKLRTMEVLWKKLGELCDVFTPQECQNYFRHAGYCGNTKLQTNA